MAELYDIAKEFLQKVTFDLDQYTRFKGEINPIKDGYVLLTPSHIHFAKNGRGAGKRPPLDPILEWVKRKGIIFEGSDEKGTAFAIQAAIAKRGTLNYKPGAPDALETAIDKYYSDYMKELNSYVQISISRDIEKTFEKYIPKEIVI